MFSKLTLRLAFLFLSSTLPFNKLPFIDRPSSLIERVKFLSLRAKVPLSISREDRLKVKLVPLPLVSIKETTEEKSDSFFSISPLRAKPNSIG